ncbi:MAG: cation transporter [Opitutae bacterium]|nr:cation transporter [Opitutae bacterium]
MSDCGCSFEARDAEQRKVLMRLLTINGTMFVTEMVVGLLAHSTGVMADSLDMLADALVYGTGLYAIGRSAMTKHRAAFWSGIFQVVLAGSILVEVARRAIYGSEPNSTLMMAVSMVALAANAYGLKLLSKHRNGEVHLRASWIFSRSDVIANAGVILAGVLVAVTDSRWPDLIVGTAIAAVVLHGGREILREANA